MMDRVGDAMDILIKDCRTEKKIVDNPQNPLLFDPGIEGKKKLNNQSIYNALQYTNAYTKALSYRLSDRGGDLYGGVLDMDQDIFSTEESGPEKSETKVSEQIGEPISNEESIALPEDKTASPQPGSIKTTGTIQDDLANLGF